MKTPFSIPLLFLTLSACSTAAEMPWSEPDEVVPTTGDCAESLRGFDALMTGFLRQHGIPGAALAVVYHGRLVVARGYGVADLETRESVAPTSLFRIASLSKPITAVAVLQLVEAGKLRLDTRIDALLSPQPLQRAGAPVDERLREIDIRQLLHHTAGFDRALSYDPMFRSIEIATALDVPPPAEPEHIVRHEWGRRLDFDPGTRYAYSNFGYSLLGRAIEKATGRAYEDHVARSVLEPLGIRNMRLGHTLWQQRAEGEVRYHHAPPVESPAVIGPIGQPAPEPYGSWYHESLDAHGGWIASAIDLARFIAAFDDEERCPLLSPSMVRRMWERPPGLAGFEADGRPRAAYYACGWMVRPRSNGKANCWHTGSLPGTAALLVRRHDGIDWALLFNRRRGVNTRHVASAIDPLIHPVADAVKEWPEIDLFAKYR